MKMAIISKLISTINIAAGKLSRGFSVELTNFILTFIWNGEGLKTAKTMWKERLSNQIFRFLRFSVKLW